MNIQIPGRIRVENKIRWLTYLAKLRRIDDVACARVPAAATYRGLSISSLALATIAPRRAAAHVNLLLPEFNPGGVFAGIKTAFEAGARIAQQRGLPIRLIPFLNDVTPKEREYGLDTLSKEFGLDRRLISFASLEDLDSIGISPDDVWVATYWTTAHSADIASRLGLIDPGRVIYLVQDYEPTFMPWNTDHSITRATYHAGFVHLINTSPLHEYLSSAEGIEIPREQVFAPHLDLARLEETAAARRPSDSTRILFYGRPGKNRNMYPLGVSSLKAAAVRLHEAGAAFEMVSVGERHATQSLAGGRALSSLGTLAWNDFFVELARADVVFALQATPHPSHLPLDSVTSGGYSVTNELGGTRGGLHERLVAATPDPDRLADAIAATVAKAAATGPHAFEPSFLGRLGSPLESAVQAVNARIPI